MRARSIVALVVAGVALLVVGAMDGGGREPAPAGVGPTPEMAVESTRRSSPTGPPTTAVRTPTTRPAPASTTSTVVPFVQGRQLTDRLEREQPLAGALPHHTSHYAIDYRVVDGRLELSVQLFAVLNGADQLAEYEGQLRRYKAEALDFIRARGEDPDAYWIAYRPPEAALL